MKDDGLLEHVQALRDELIAANNIEAGKKDLVGNLLTDAMVHASGTKPDGVVSRKYSEVLQDQVAHFESDHPKIAGMIDRLATMLSSLGI